MNILIDITLDVIRNILYFVKQNLINFANILDFTIPFLMFFIGQNVALREGKILISPEIIIPLFAFILIFYLKSIADKIGKGITIPIPNKRFTEVDDDGEVSVENARLQEMLLYMADLEDWLNRKGLL